MYSKEFLIPFITNYIGEQALNFMNFSTSGGGINFDYNLPINNNYNTNPATWQSNTGVAITKYNKSPLIENVENKYTYSIILKGSLTTYTSYPTYIMKILVRNGNGDFLIWTASSGYAGTYDFDIDGVNIPALVGSPISHILIWNGNINANTAGRLVIKDLQIKCKYK